MDIWILLLLAAAATAANIGPTSNVPNPNPNSEFGSEHELPLKKPHKNPPLFPAVPTTNPAKSGPSFPEVPTVPKTPNPVPLNAPKAPAFGNPRSSEERDEITTLSDTAPAPAGPPFSKSPAPAGPPFSKSPTPAVPPFSKSPAPAGPPFPESPAIGGPPFSKSPAPAGAPFSKSPAPGEPPFSKSPAPAGPPFSKSPAPAGPPFSKSPVPAGPPFSKSPAPGGTPFSKSPAPVNVYESSPRRPSPTLPENTANPKTLPTSAIHNVPQGAPANPQQDPSAQFAPPNAQAMPKDLNVPFPQNAPQVTLVPLKPEMSRPGFVPSNAPPKSEEFDTSSSEETGKTHLPSHSRPKHPKHPPHHIKTRAANEFRTLTFKNVLHPTADIEEYYLRTPAEPRPNKFFRCHREDRRHFVSAPQWLAYNCHNDVNPMRLLIEVPSSLRSEAIIDVELAPPFLAMAKDAWNGKYDGISKTKFLHDLLTTKSYGMVVMRPEGLTTRMVPLPIAVADDMSPKSSVNPADKPVGASADVGAVGSPPGAPGAPAAPPKPKWASDASSASSESDWTREEKWDSRPEGADSKEWASTGPRQVIF